MTIGIYGIFNAKTDECLYIGMSKNIEERWKSHLKLLKNKRHRRKDFVEWYHSNGADPSLIDFKILEECEYDESVLNILEIKWFNSLKPKYYGAKPSLNNKWTISEETRKKISQAGKGRIPHNKGKILRSLVCQNCENIFHSNAKQPKYCSRDCRKNFENKRFNKKELTDKYNSGMSLHALAEEYNCSYRTIHAYMVRHNISRRSFSDIYNSLDEIEKTNRATRFQSKIESLEKIVCSICDKLFSATSIKRHMEACANKPKCMDCQTPVVKNSAKRCGKCYKAFQAAQKRSNINKCIDCGSAISKSSAKRCVPCYKNSLKIKP